MSRVVIVGAGGHGAIVADMLLEAAAAREETAHGGAPDVIVGLVDDDPARAGTKVLGLPVLGPIASLSGIDHDAVIVAIGDNRLRQTLTERLCAAGERLATAIHPRASIAASATIGAGSMISAGAIVLPRAVIGRGVILNTKASVDHDSVVGEFAHVAVGATVGANVRIGAETLVAIGASVVSGVTVGARTVIGAGAAVVRDIPDEVTALGVPARITADRRPGGATR